MTALDAPPIEAYEAAPDAAPVPRRRNGNGGMPHDLAAEAALLGAALLVKPAAEIVAGTLTASDFYKPAHQNIAYAISTLYLDGKPTDVVSVATELGDLLEPSGGGRYLMELQTGTPATSSAPHYADIVLGHARRRRQIHLAEQLATAARDSNDTAVANALTDLRHHQETVGADELDLEDMAAALDDDTDEQPTILKRDDGVALLYPAAVNVIQSEPSLGKSWLALIAVAEVLTAGGTVLYLDYEDAPKRIGRRLTHQLALDRTTIISRFHYKRPGTLSPKGLAALPRLAQRLNADLVVIDGVADAMACQGHDENEASGLLAWWTTIPRPLSYTGACVLLLDHVTKSKENRGRWARGTGAKLAAVDGAAYALDALVALSRQRAGKLKLTVAKDRHGVIGAMGDLAGMVDIDPLEHPGRFTWKTTAPTSDAYGEWQGPTDCMAAIVDLLKSTTEEITRSQVPKKLRAINPKGYRDIVVYDALERLVAIGEIVARKAGRATYYTAPTDQPSELWEDQF